MPGLETEGERTGRKAGKVGRVPPRAKCEREGKRRRRKGDCFYAANLSVFQARDLRFTFSPSQQPCGGRDFCPHFTDGETEA